MIAGLAVAALKIRIAPLAGHGSGRHRSPLRIAVGRIPCENLALLAYTNRDKEVRT
jgi:hypothetical protein